MEKDPGTLPVYALQTKRTERPTCASSPPTLRRLNGPDWLGEHHGFWVLEIGNDELFDAVDVSDEAGRVPGPGAPGFSGVSLLEKELASPNAVLAKRAGLPGRLGGLPPGLAGLPPDDCEVLLMNHLQKVQRVLNMVFHRGHGYGRVCTAGRYRHGDRHHERFRHTTVHKLRTACNGLFRSSKPTLLEH